MSGAGTVVITGATGLVGGRLVPALLRDRWRVHVLTRDPARAVRRLGKALTYQAWDGLRAPEGSLAGAAAVVHLAGEPIFAGPLTRSRRARVRRSRIDSARSLVQQVARLPAHQRPGALLCASAVGIYGSHGETVLAEDASPGNGFLAELCMAWERAARDAEPLGVRVVCLRMGVVLGREGGALPSLMRLFRWGLGAQLGDGRQWVAWIHADDLVQLIRFALVDDTLHGPVNAVAPHPVRNRQWTHTLAGALGRPAWLVVPRTVLRAALGELSVELLGSRRAVPRRLQQAGFRFRFPELSDALAAERAPAPDPARGNVSD